MSPGTKPIIKSIVALHFDEAAFLWSQREVAARAVNYTLHDLAAIDEQVEAHIDGLKECLQITPGRFARRDSTLWTLALCL